MILVYLVITFLFFFLFYNIYTSFSFQVMSRRRHAKKYLGPFIERTHGIYHKKAYFGSIHKTVSIKEFNSFSNRHKVTFSPCYNVITFKTKDANWDVLFYLIKEGLLFNEILTLRAFPNTNRIKSEGSIEKVHGRINVLANNKYLADILESPENKETIKELLTSEGDILMVTNNCIYYKSFIKKERVNSNVLMAKVKCIHSLKEAIYRKGVIEY